MNMYHGCMLLIVQLLNCSRCWLNRRSILQRSFLYLLVHPSRCIRKALSRLLFLDRQISGVVFKEQAYLNSRSFSSTRAVAYIVQFRILLRGEQLPTFFFLRSLSAWCQQSKLVDFQRMCANRRRNEAEFTKAACSTDSWIWLSSLIVAMYLTHSFFVGSWTKGGIYTYIVYRVLLRFWWKRCVRDPLFAWISEETGMILVPVCVPPSTSHSRHLSFDSSKTLLFWTYLRNPVRGFFLSTVFQLQCGFRRSSRASSVRRVNGALFCLS